MSASQSSPPQRAIARGERRITRRLAGGDTLRATPPRSVPQGDVIRITAAPRLAEYCHQRDETRRQAQVDKLTIIEDLIEGVEIGRMIDLAQWTKESDSVVTF